MVETNLLPAAVDLLASTPVSWKGFKKIEIGVLVVAILASAMTPSEALAKQNDVAATRAYIHARYSFEKSAKAELPVERAAASTLVKEIRDSCPNVAAHSPHDEQAAILNTEILVVVSDSLLRLDHAAIRRFVGVVEKLRWSNSALTRAAAQYVQKLKGELALKAPNLCSDLGAWRASGFRTLRPDVVRSIREAEAVSTGREEVPTHLLSPYTRPDDRALLHRTTLLESQVGDALVKLGLQASSQISKAVGLTS